MKLCTNGGKKSTTFTRMELPTRKVIFHCNRRWTIQPKLYEALLIRSPHVQRPETGKIQKAQPIHLETLPQRSHGEVPPEEESTMSHKSQRYCSTHHRWFNACCWECEETPVKKLITRLPPHLRPQSEEELAQWRATLAESLLIERNAQEGV